MNKFIGNVVNGGLRIMHKNSYDAILAGLEGKKVTIIIKRFMKPRSTGKANETGNQNGYYWAHMIPVISGFTRYTHDEVNEAIKHKFLRIGGSDDFPKIKSTGDLDTKEFEELMEKIRIYFKSEHNLDIMSVGDYYKGYLEYYEQTNR